MSAPAQPIHCHFKVFASRLGPDDTLGGLADDVVRFVASEGVAAKSIGVEYLEEEGILLLSLGYRTDEPGYPVSLSCVSLGRDLALGCGADFGPLERRMETASAGLSRIICHELYVTQENELLMVFLTQEG